MNSIRAFVFTKRLYSHPFLCYQFGDAPVFIRSLLSSQFHASSKYANSKGTTNVQKEDPYILQPINKSSCTALKIKKISKAMKAYLERAKSHNVFLDTKNDEFEIGKHHLANMMGLEVGTMTQEDIDKAIEYLLPSGLYEPKARPLMKPPEELFPKEKSAQFDDSGRPFSPFFYTKMSNFNTAMHEFVKKFEELDAFEDKMLRKGISQPPDEYKLDLSGGEWFTLDEISKVFLEKLTNIDHEFFTTTLIRLSQHPYGFRCKDFIWQYRKDFLDIGTKDTVSELMYEEDGRPYVMAECKKKTARAKVTVWGNGTGKLDICGKNISYFYRLEERQQIMFPLELCQLLDKVDIKATVQLGGIAGQAGAIRGAISLCLKSFVSEECRERMRLAGLLTYDPRKRERHRPGRRGPRAKYRWVKR